MPEVSKTKPWILPEDEEEAERTFNDLPVQQQLEFVLRYHGNERLRHLFLSHQGRELVQRLPEIELFLMVKKSGERDALELVSLTSPEQFQYLLDLDFWNKDQLDLGKATQWMGTLLECGEEKVREFIQSTDPEFIALLLKKFLHVMKFEGEPAEVPAGPRCSPLTNSITSPSRNQRRGRSFSDFWNICTMWMRNCMQDSWRP